MLDLIKSRFERNIHASIKYKLLYGALLFILGGLILVVGPQLTPVPERSELTVVEGKVTDITRERQDRKSDLPPASILHVCCSNGEVRQVRVQAWLMDAASVAALRGRSVRARYGYIGIYELEVGGRTVIDYDTVATDRRKTLANIPYGGAGIMGLGLLFLLAYYALFGRPTRPPGPSAPAPRSQSTRRPSTADGTAGGTPGGFGRR